MHDAPSRKEKKQKTPRTQYLLWWKQPGQPKRTYGPVYSKKAVQRDVAYYQNLYGEENAGWEMWTNDRRREDGDRKRRGRD